MQLTEEIRREIGQHFVLGFHGHEVSEDIKTLIQTYYLGNVILMKRNVQSARQIRSVVTQLQQLAQESGHEKPLMIGIDQENGLVSAFSTANGQAGTQFPGAMALAATGSPDSAEAASRGTAKELKAVGINWAYSPVADVNSNSRNPVIGVRSFSDDPTEASGYVCAVARGLASEGIAPSPKHFPGHGDTDVDSHLGLPVIPKPLAALEETELVPFKALVKEGVASIMTAHIALPQLELSTSDSDGAGGSEEKDVPASLSHKVNTGLLRQRMGYDGVIVTDCLEMNGVKDTFGVDKGAVMALRAGADIVMICHTMSLHLAALHATYAAVGSGTLSLPVLRASGARIITFKDTFAGAWADALGVSPDAAARMDAFETTKAKHAVLSTELYTRSTALIPSASSSAPGPAGSAALPFSRTERVLLFTPQMESVNLAVDDAEGVLRTPGTDTDSKPRVRNTAGPSYLAFAEFIRTRLPAPEACEHIVYASTGLDPAASAQLARATQVVFTLRNADLSAWQMEVLRTVLRSVQEGEGGDGRTGARVKVAVVSSCAPYDVLSLARDGVDADANANAADVALLATFEFTPPAFEAATAILFGQAQARGRVPVRLSS